MRPGYRTPVATAAEIHPLSTNQCFDRARTLRRFVPGRLVQDSVHWSPDGLSVFFTHGRNVYAAAVDGTNVRQLVNPVPIGYGESQNKVSSSEIGVMSAVSVSPDGATLLHSTCAFPRGYPDSVRGAPLTQQDYQYDIALVSTTSGEPRRLTVHDAYDNFPVWSPDGTRIAFLSARHRELEAEAFARPHLYTMSADGSEVRRLSAGLEFVINHSPQWSPDGERLAFVAVGRPGASLAQNLYTVRADGTDLRRLGPAISGPSWSPDGRRLAFAQPEATTVALVTIAADGTDVRRVTTIERWKPDYYERKPVDAWIESVVWSPAGTHILVRPDDKHSAIVAGVDVPGRTVVGLVRWDARLGTPGEGRFLGIRAAGWSPDGAWLVLVGPEHVVTVAANGGPLRGVAQWYESDESWQPLNVGQELAPPDVTGCTFGAAVPEPDANPGLVTDCATLLEVQQALADGAALNWDVYRPIGQWEGVSLGGTPRRVHVVSLENPPHSPNRAPPPTLSGLHRPLPAALGRLTQLRVLNLTRNQITGPIPAELGELSSLQELFLDSNHLSGQIPPELGRLSALVSLGLSANRLTGPIPKEFGQLRNLNGLSLRDNQLTGPIPAELGLIESLGSLDLGGNQLTGCIPAALSRLKPNYTDVDDLGLPFCEPAA